MENAPKPTIGVVTWLLLAGNLVAFALVKPSGGEVAVETLVACGALERGLVWSGEYWRFVTAMFLHIGWAHLVWNCAILPSVALPVERTLGRERLLVAYLLSGIGAAAVAVLCREQVLVGLGGGALGLIGVRIGRSSASDFAQDGGLRWTFIMLVVSIAIAAAFVPRVDLIGAFAGLGFGALIGWAYRAPRAARRTAIVGALVVLAAVAAGIPWPGLKAPWSALKAAEAGHAAFKAGDFTAAVTHLTRAERYGHRDRALYVNRGRALHELAEYKRAAADFDTAVQWGDDDRSARLLRGWARLRTNDAKGALADFNECASYDPKNASALVGRGAVCLALGEFDAAMANLDHALRLDDRLHEALYYRATAHDGRGRRDAAIRDYESALAKAPPGWAARSDVEKKLEFLRKENR